MSEQTAYRTLKSHFPPSSYIERIENVLGAGFPDVIYTLNGVTGFIEIKSPKEPKKNTTPLFGSNHKLSQEQLNWFQTQERAGGRSFIFIATDKRWLILPGRVADLVNAATVIDIKEMSTWHKTRGSRDGWSDMLKELQRS